MGLILDSSILIAGERRGESVKQIIENICSQSGDAESALSSIGIIELAHGIYRAKTAEKGAKRKAFVEEMIRDLIIQPVTAEIARLAGRIEGEQVTKGISIAVEDLII